MIGNIDNLLNLTNHIFQHKKMKPVFMEIALVAKYLWDRGWAERNAGNFSINVTGLFSSNELDRLSGYPFFPLSRRYPDLSGTLFLVSGTGARMREMADNPRQHVCFVYISNPGTAYHIVSVGHEEGSVKPTSELATHLAVQQQLVQKKATEKVVLHAHITELIALTQLAPFKTEEYLNTLFWGMHPETIFFVPGGVGFIPYVLPGTENIAQATIKGLENHKAVLWEKHGSMAIGKDLPEAFDILDILAKSAKIYFLCKSTGLDPEGLTLAQIEEIRNNYPG